MDSEELNADTIAAAMESHLLKFEECLQEIKAVPIKDDDLLTNKMGLTLLNAGVHLSKEYIDVHLEEGFRLDDHIHDVTLPALSALHHILENNVYAESVVLNPQTKAALTKLESALRDMVTYLNQVLEYAKKGQAYE